MAILRNSAMRVRERQKLNDRVREKLLEVLQNPDVPEKVKEILLGAEIAERKGNLQFASAETLIF